MLFAKFQKTSRSTPKGSLVPACLGLSFIFILGIFMSGCVVHHKGHGYNRGHGLGHHKGHHKKGHIKIKPHVGISVSPLIVIDD